MTPTLSDSVLAELIDTYRRDAVAPQHFFQAWQQAVLLAGSAYFGNGKRDSVTAARDKWELHPNVPLIQSAIGAMSHGEQVFIAALVSVYDDQTGGRLLRRVGVNGSADFGLLDTRRRTLIANLIVTPPAGRCPSLYAHRRSPMPFNNHSLNPFLRGFNDLRIQRLLAVLYDAQAPLCHLPPHPSQQHLTDDQLARHPCLFNNQHALIVNSSAARAAHEDSYPCPGIVVQVIYGIFSHDQSPPMLVGDLYSETLAQERILQLTFETGHYSRCWEISSAHLPQVAWETLMSIPFPMGLLLEAFELPDSSAFGLKLIATPWTDRHLGRVEGCTTKQLRQQQLDAGLSEELVEVLHLAGQADVRILIFDPDAGCLSGLPVYDHQP
ncbi:hypothetical protein C4K03_2378 [Pseudomonas synxantha]|uniref:DUF5983 domain-containing protein n=1 Tax=Pseudomonas synxantha TaxID=47883 RepID=A0A3G7U593_9PSED|nr:hypothetical protein [Pseudomonas synxantha]AZE54533.1 hypothetical protein C4K03_2378 [Pseudomonas synxantha]